MATDNNEPDYILLSQAKKDKELRAQEREKVRTLLDKYRTTDADRKLLKEALGLDADRAIQ